MKKFILSLSLLGVGLAASAQIPYYAATVGHGKFNGYTSVKFRPGINAQETYSSFQYGLSDYGAAGLDLYTSNGEAYSGFLIRGGYVFSKWFGVGAQVTPSFNLNDSFKFSFLSAALYMNGNITSDGKLFWASNTFANIYRHEDNSFMNWEYIGLNLPTRKGQSVTPMVGAIHSWQFDRDVDLAVGAYYSLGPWCFYLWSNDLLESHPRIVTGIEFTF